MKHISPANFSIRNSNLESAIKAIYAKRYFFSALLTGGGITTASRLLTATGGSQSVAGIHLPYAVSATRMLLERCLPSWKSKDISSLKAVSSDMANIQAEAMFHDAVTIGMEDDGRWDQLKFGNVLGISCTAALATNRQLKGDHRCVISVFDGIVIRIVSVTFDKGKRSRVEEDELCAAYLVTLLATIVGVELEESLSPFVSAELTEVITSGKPFEEVSFELVSSTGTDIVSVWATPVEESIPVEVDVPSCKLYIPNDSDNIDLWLSLPSPKISSGRSIVLSCSANPLHRGHVELAMACLSQIDDSIRPLVVFELSIANADKGSLSIEETRRRLKQFSKSSPVLAPLVERGIDFVVCTTVNAPTFAEKARCLPGSIFAVGADTMERVLQARYYAPPDASPKLAHTSLAAAMASIVSANCRFVVGGRYYSSLQQFLTWDSIVSDFDDGRTILKSLPSLCIGLDENTFRVDLSSTQLRAAIAEKIRDDRQGNPPSSSDRLLGSK